MFTCWLLRVGLDRLFCCVTAYLQVLVCVVCVYICVVAFGSSGQRLTLIGFVVRVTLLVRFGILVVIGVCLLIWVSISVFYS